jgi:hypothetical protein
MPQGGELGDGGSAVDTFPLMRVKLGGVAVGDLFQQGIDVGSAR